MARTQLSPATPTIAGSGTSCATWVPSNTTPEVRPRLEALLGSEFAYFLHNMLGGEKITLEDDHLVLQGTSIKPHLGDSADETAALVVCVADGALYVGLQWHGAVTIRGEAPSYDDLPAALRAWVAWWHGIRR